MTSIVPRILSSSDDTLAKASPIYFRSRPPEITNFALMALALDLLLTVAAFVLANEATAAHLFNGSLSGPGIVLFIVLVWPTMFLLMEVYPAAGLRSMSEEVFRAIFAAANGFFILVAVLSLSAVPLAQEFFLFFIVLDIFLVIAWRLVTRSLFQMPHFNSVVQRTMVIGINDRSMSFASMVATNPKSRIKVCGFLDDCIDAQVMDIPVFGGLRDNLLRIIEQNGIDSVVIALPSQENSALGDLLKQLRSLPVSLHVIPSNFDPAIYGSSAEAVDHVFMNSLPRHDISMRERMLKRLLDLVLASCALLLVLPVGVVIAIAIKLDSKGPIFFRQLRIGEYQRPFYMYKFRSMVPNAEVLQKDVNVVTEQGSIIHKRPDDPRVTRVGKIIRKTSLDELPQLLNVLLCDMSLVGPRPEMPWVVKSYEPWQYQRFAVPPGMTGWWQINGRRDQQPMHMGTEDDLYYIEHYSFLLDLRIMALTIPVVLSGRGSF